MWVNQETGPSQNKHEDRPLESQTSQINHNEETMTAACEKGICAEKTDKQEGLDDFAVYVAASFYGELSPTEEASVKPKVSRTKAAHRD